jgi:ADP-glucose pyrophosphorylase
MPSYSDIMAVILGGGQGQRLYPLTLETCQACCADCWKISVD